MIWCLLCVSNTHVLLSSKLSFARQIANDYRTVKDIRLMFQYQTRIECAGLWLIQCDYKFIILSLCVCVCFCYVYEFHFVLFSLMHRWSSPICYTIVFYVCMSYDVWSVIKVMAKTEIYEKRNSFKNSVTGSKFVSFFFGRLLVFSCTFNSTSHIRAKIKNEVIKSEFIDLQIVSCEKGQFCSHWYYASIAHGVN